MTVIDCHQHFWRLAEFPHSFPPAVGDRLDRDFTEDDLRPALAECGVDQTVLVQSLNDLDETEAYLDLAGRVDYVAGVVGWVPLADPGACAAALERLAGRTGLVGIPSGCSSPRCCNLSRSSRRPTSCSRASR
jgi:L-fuconolactonase